MRRAGTQSTVAGGGVAMMNLSAWYAVFAGAGLLWHECGHDLGVFCYRIGCGVFCAARQRAFELVPLRATINPARTTAAFSNRSFTFFARCTRPKDLKDLYAARELR